MIYDRLAPYYDQFIDPELNHIYLELIDKYYKDGTILDLGCGTAALSVTLAKQGFHVTATDISPEMLDRANNNAVNEGATIYFFIHDIIEPINQTYDVLLMSSDVINYVHNRDDVHTVLQHVSDAMHKDSIFIFDFIHLQYIERIHNYHQDILLDDDVLQWTVRKTNRPFQIRHTLKLGLHQDHHLQTSFPPKTYRKILKEVGLTVVRKTRTEERIIFLCKKR